MLRLILAASLTESATAVSIAAVTFSEPACRAAVRSLAVLAVFFTDSRAASGTSRFWSLLSASVTGAKASLTVFSTELVSVSVVIWGLSILRFELWAHPVRLARGKRVVPQLMVHRNINVAMRYHEFVISSGIMRSACGTGAIPQRTSAGRRPA